MKTVVGILYSEDKVSSTGNKYKLTTVVLSDGMEVATTLPVKVGDQVQPWFDDKWDMIKLKIVKSVDA